MSVDFQMTQTLQIGTLYFLTFDPYDCEDAAWLFVAKPSSGSGWMALVIKNDGSMGYAVRYVSNHNHIGMIAHGRVVTPKEIIA
jgi:hypothetical protein